MERLTELKCDITKLDAKIKNMQERIDKMAFDDKEEVGIKFLASTVSYLNELREYKQLEEQGLLLRLYCNVGDTVYCIKDKKIWDCIVDKVTISRTNGLWFEVKTPKSMPDISAIEYTENAFGETVFLTQGEAEQKLKEMESNYE